MSINFYQFRSFLGCLCIVYILSSCAHSAIPQIYIPEKKGELDASICLGVDGSGLHSNWIYGLTDQVCLQSAVSFSAPSPTLYGEFGLGLKTPGFAKLVSVTYGRGIYGYGSLAYGGSYGIYWYYGNFNKYAFASNIPFTSRAGMATRITLLRGKENGADNCRNCHPYTDKLFSRVYFEPSLYYKFGKRSRFYGVMLARLPILARGTVNENDAFVMSYANLTFGWNFRVLKGHAQ